eukprot:scpid48613/ scgid8531/ 
MAQTAGLLSLLAEFGMQRFHVEYRVYRSNHLLHALVALHGLGARDGRLEEIAKHMATDYPLEPARASEGDLQGDEWKLLLGKKKRFVDLRKFFTAKVDSLGAGSAIAEYYTPLLDGGVACAALPLQPAHRPLSACRKHTAQCTQSPCGRSHVLPRQQSPWRLGHSPAQRR